MGIEFSFSALWCILHLLMILHATSNHNNVNNINTTFRIPLVFLLYDLILEMGDSDRGFIRIEMFILCNYFVRYPKGFKIFDEEIFVEMLILR